MSSETHKDGKWDNFPKNEKELEKYGVWVKSGPKDISPEKSPVILDKPDIETSDLNEMPDFSFLDNHENIAFENKSDDFSSKSSSSETENSSFTLSDQKDSEALNDDDFSIEDLNLDELELNMSDQSSFSEEDPFDNLTDMSFDDNIEEAAFDDPFAENELQAEIYTEEKLDIDSSVLSEEIEPILEAFIEEIPEIIENDFSDVPLELAEPAFNEDVLEQKENLIEEDFSDLTFEIEESPFTEEVSIEESLVDDDIIAFSEEKINMEAEIFDDDNLTDPIHQIMDSKPQSAVEDDEKSILQKIAAELSVLHSEFVSLKKEIESLKQLGIKSQQQENVPEIKNFYAEEKTTESISSEPEHISVEMESVEKTDEENISGFFSANVEDDAIALSGDELNNILANADFTQEIVSEEPSILPEIQIPVEEQAIADIAEIIEDVDNSIFDMDMPAKITFDDEKLEEPSLDTIEMPNFEEETLEEIDLDLTDDIFVASEGDEESAMQIDEEPVMQIDEEPVMQIDEEPVMQIDEEPVMQIDEEPVMQIDEEPVMQIDEEPVMQIDEEPVMQIDEEPAMQIDEEPVMQIDEEPVMQIDEEPAMQIDEEILTDNLIYEDLIGDEPTLDEIVLEPVFENEKHEISIEDALDDDVFAIPQEAVAEETAIVEEPLFNEVVNVDDIFVPADEEEKISQPLSDDNLSYLQQNVPFNQIDEIREEDEEDLDLPTETVFESDQWNEEPVGEPVTQALETPIETQMTENSDNPVIPQDLKFEIKSVLSYMDQLLENLPEEKIAEFAQSEHFDTYKKLFKELGLS